MSKVVIVSGASQGIGRATAVRISKDPTVGTVILVARSEEGLQETAAAIDPADATVEVHPIDLADLAAIPALVDGVAQRYGRIDGLMNVAGYAEPDALLDTTDENIEKTYAVNVFSLIVMTRECVRHMRGRPAKIVNVASTAGVTPRPGWLAYASSKAAVIAISQTLTDELSEYGIRVYTVSPGRCATELRRRLAPDEDPSTIMQPEHVADVIADLFDERESCLDGQNVIVRQLPRRLPS